MRNVMFVWVLLTCSQAWALTVTPESGQARIEKPVDVGLRDRSAPDADSVKMTAGTESDARGAEILAMRADARVADDVAASATTGNIAVDYSQHGVPVVFGMTLLVLVGLGVFVLGLLSRKFNRERTRR